MNKQHSQLTSPASETSPPVPPYGPQPVPPFIPLIPPGLFNYVASLQQQMNFASLDNERLRNQLQKKHLAEESYTAPLTFADHCICTQSKYGTWVPILNRTIEQAVYVAPSPPLRSPPFYIIRFSQSEHPITLSEESYFRDAILISRLQEAGGVEVTIRKSLKTTARLIRQAISRKLTVLPISIYAGWSKQNDGKPCFSTFPPFSSHWQAGSFLLPHVLSDASPATAELAVQKWMPAFSLLQSSFASWFLTLWFHMSALSSLLNRLGFQLPLGLYLFSDDPVGLAYLRRLFCWFGDSALSMGIAPELFNDGLLARKDQPLVIEDTCQGKNAKLNTATLEEMLLSHSAPWKNGRNTQYLPIQALPTILAPIVSGLACSPNLIVLDLPSGQLLSSRFAKEFPLQENLNEYLSAFANYTTRHIAELRAQLNTARDGAWEVSNGTLSESCVGVLGILLGLHRFLEDFYASYGFDTLPLSDAQVDKQMPQLLNLLQETNDKAEVDGCLDNQFISIARSMIQCHQLEARPLSQRRAASNGTTMVYFDGDSLYFTPAALKTVCQQLGYSRPVVLRALSDAGLLQGSRINQTTVMTRIQLWNVHGIPQPTAVYRLRRDAFERLGEPLLLDEGGTL